MARENLLNFKEEFDVEILDDPVKVFYKDIIHSNSFEEFEINLKNNKLVNENKKLKKENVKLKDENKKLKKNIEAIKKNYNDIKSSNTWKLAAPLRKIKNSIFK